jgi:K+-sensing histidine kinase KdpD
LNRLLFENNFTYFAEPARLHPDEVTNQADHLKKLEKISCLLDASGVVILLNQYRQIVYYNEAFLEFIDMADHDTKKVIGRRPGEALKCIHSHRNEAGCGTSEYCSTCGAALAILAGQKGEKNSKECRITISNGKKDVSLELMVTAAPFSLDMQDFVIIFITNISDEKRRKALECIFFHDVINTAGGLHGLIQLIDINEQPPQTRNIIKDITDISNTLLEEIKSQRDLVYAENNELVIELRSVQSIVLIRETIKQFLNHQIAMGKILEIAVDSDNVCFNTDPVILKRILANMIKNALESSTKGDTIKIGVKKREKSVEFWVNNSLVMPRVVQLQIFQRSFSTKGIGRGLGTYSMKLLTERYLKGSISFQVSECEGTTFAVSLPLMEK